jgi:hypothetical protein
VHPWSSQIVRASLLIVLVPAGAVAQPADTIGRSRDPLFTGRDALIAAGFAIGTAASFPVDRAVAGRLQQPSSQENLFLRRTSRVLRTIAYPGTLIIGGTMYAVGRIADEERMADLGLHGTEALLVGAMTSYLIKGLVGRARPSIDADEPEKFGFLRGFLGGDDYQSFPSGHSVAGFAVAAAVSSETARWWPDTRWLIGPIVYGGAALIGASRMYDNRHWASDVVVGAAIGTFAGLKVVRYHHTHPDNRLDGWLLSASISRGERGERVVRWMILPGALATR